MDELIKRIEKIRDLIKGLNVQLKPKQSLVPAIKPPSVKPLSMPPVSVGGTDKLPGVAPSSNKDPKKIAEQLKNPRPTKPRMEILKFDRGGQWTLSALNKGVMQRIAPISPVDKVKYSAQAKHIQPWIRGKAPDHSIRETVDRLDGPARTRALHKLHKITQVRKNPNTGEREFLLRRSMSNNEFDAHNKGAIKQKTSWTPYNETGSNFEDEGDYDRVVWAWVPEKHIHHIPIAVSKRGQDEHLDSLIEKEHEVIVDPHRLQIESYS